MGAKFNRKDFLDALFFNYCRDKGGFILVRSSDRHMVKTSTRYFPNPDTLAKEQYPEDQNVFFGVCPREKMKPGKEFIQRMTVVWAGLDVGPDGHSGKEKHFVSEKQAVIALKSFPLAPSIVVRSGRGLHLYWLLREPKEVTDPAAVEAVLKRVNDFFQCCSETGLETSMRLPETWNPKNPAAPVQCWIQHMDASARYNFEQFESLDLRVVIPSKRMAPIQPAPAPAVRSRVTVIQDDEEPARMAELGGPRIVSAPSFRGHTDLAPEFGHSSGPGHLEDPDAEKMVERFLEGFSEKLLDKLADRIVDKLMERLPIGGRGKPQD